MENIKIKTKHKMYVSFTGFPPMWVSNNWSLATSFTSITQRKNMLVIKVGAIYRLSFLDLKTTKFFFKKWWKKKFWL